MASFGQNIALTSADGHGIVSTEANTGNPLKGDFERMARRRFQDPTPKRRGEWWTIQVRQDVFIDGKLKRSNNRVRLAPAAMSEREVRKIAAEYLRPLNQGMQAIGSATNFTHYVQYTYLRVVMPLMAKAREIALKGSLRIISFLRSASSACAISPRSRSSGISRIWRLPPCQGNHATRFGTCSQAFCGQPSLMGF
jgi:hypothetical protein